MATLYKTDGQPEEVKPRSGDVFELDELQTIVGGYIEIVRTHSNKAMVINEEGKLKNLPLNYLATRLYKYGRFDPIVGPALVVSRKEMR